jgi:hypothetical protein
MVRIILVGYFHYSTIRLGLLNFFLEYLTVDRYYGGSLDFESSIDYLDPLRFEYYTVVSIPHSADSGSCDWEVYISNNLDCLRRKNNFFFIEEGRCMRRISTPGKLELISDTIFMTVKAEFFSIHHPEKQKKEYIIPIKRIIC